jgi:hypothetical protein
MDRLDHLNKCIEDLQEQLAGLEIALTQAEPGAKTRLQQQIRDKKKEIGNFEAEKAKWLASSAPVSGQGDRSTSVSVSPAGERATTASGRASVTPLTVFISYAHRDEDLKEDLVMHLAALKRQGKIEAWHDRDIEGGVEWDAVIQTHLEAAEIILLLITPGFLASDACFDRQLQRSIQRHKAGTARVIPILLKPCDWEGTPFSQLQVLPKNQKPVTTWENRDQAFLEIVQEIRRAVDSLSP